MKRIGTELGAVALLLLWPSLAAPSPAAAELLNLRTDPAEQHNLWTEQPERARRMQAQLSAILGK